MEDHFSLSNRERHRERERATSDTSEKSVRQAIVWCNSCQWDELVYEHAKLPEDLLLEEPVMESAAVIVSRNS